MSIAMKAMGEEKFVSMARQMAKWVDHVLGSGYQKYHPGETWTPAINLYESHSAYCVVVDLAGIKADEIDLRVEEGMLIIAGDRPSPEMPPNCDLTCMHLMEIDHGRFCRRLQIPGDVVVDGIRASYRNGYLRITIPRAK